MQRSRVASNVSPVREYWTLTINGGTPISLFRDSNVFSKHSTMVDEIHGKVNRPESPCAHVKIVTTKPTYPNPPLVFTGAGTNRFDIDPPGGHIAFDPSSIPGPPPSVVGYKWDRFLETAFKEFTEQFNEEVSLANFIFELKDFKDAFHQAKRLLLGSNLKGGGFFRSLGQFLHDRAANGVGGNILDLELNWKSFASDLPKVLSAYSVAMKRLEFLISHQHFQVHRRTRYTIDPGSEGFTEVQIVDLADLSPYLGTYQVWCVPKDCQVTYNASAFIDNHLQLEDINAWWAVADALGLNNSPRIVWNAVKLSWVADMFLDTDEFLDAFEVEAYSGKLVTPGGTASYKVQRWYDIVVRMPNNDDIPYTIQEVVVGGCMVTDYVRTPVTLIRPSLLSLKPELSTHQQVLLTSLADAQTGLTAGGLRQTAEYAGRFRKNLKTFGKSFWKGVNRKRRLRRLG